MKKKGYRGNRPYKLKPILKNDDWLLFELNRKVTDQNYVNLKLVSRRAKLNKANYRLGWSISNQRFVNTRDFRILLEYDSPTAEWLTAGLLPLT